MKKLILLFILSFCALIVYGGNYNTGTNQIYQLLTAVGKGDSFNYPDAKNESFVRTSYDVEYTTEKYALSYYGTDEEYYMILAFNWTDKAYEQGEDPVVISHYNDEDDAGVKEDNDLSMLHTIDFSGNKFRDVSIDGKNVIALKTVDLSNNPTLESLVIEDCPNLEDVNVSYCELTFEQIKDIEDNISLKAGGTFTYAMQGDREAVYDAVDLNALLAANGEGTQVDWSVEPVSSVGNVYVFAEAQDDVILSLTNTNYPSYTIQYNYFLLGGTPVTFNIDETHCSISIENLTNPGKLAVVGNEIQITVIP